MRGYHHETDGMTDPQLEREAIALFEWLLEIAEGDRDAWLSMRTEGRPRLRKRIEAMRASDRASPLDDRSLATRDGGTMQPVLPAFRWLDLRVARRDPNPKDENQSPI